MVMLRFSTRVNGLDSIAITKLDVLDGLDTIYVCEKYEYDGQTIKDFPANMKVLAKCKPVYRKFKGWRELGDKGWTTAATQGFSTLPREARDYMAYVSKSLGVHLALVGVGKRRDQIIDMRKGGTRRAR